MRAALLGLLMTAALASSAEAGIFGLEGGQAVGTMASAKPVPGDEPFVFEIVPPRPDAAFATYRAAIYPGVGLCSIEAFATPPAEAGLAGAEAAIARQAALAATFDDAYGAAVDEEYGDGSGSRAEDLAEGSITVIRTYSGEGHTIPAGLEGISLLLESLDGIAQVYARYDFAGQDACLDARNAAIDAAPSPQ